VGIAGVEGVDLPQPDHAIIAAIHIVAACADRPLMMRSAEPRRSQAASWW
jgi:hypothetical protein